MKILIAGDVSFIEEYFYKSLSRRETDVYG